MSRKGRKQGPRRRCRYCGARCWNTVCACCVDLPRLDPFIDPSWFPIEQSTVDVSRLDALRSTR